MKIRHSKSGKERKIPMTERIFSMATEKNKKKDDGEFFSPGEKGKESGR